MWGKWTIGNGTSVFEAGFMYSQELVLGKWHRSNERKCGKHPFASFMMNKKWTLEEEFNKHMLRFQQVTVTSIYFSNYILTFQAGLTMSEVLFKAEKEDNEPKKLRMEHFYFPLGMSYIECM